MPDLNSWKNVVLLKGEGHESHDSERSNQASPFSDLEVLPNLRMHQRRRFSEAINQHVLHLRDSLLALDARTNSLILSPTLGSLVLIALRL